MTRYASLTDAIAELRRLQVPFDRAYRDIFPQTNPEAGLSGLHVYFNNGENVTVAYYTPIFESLTIIADNVFGRPDHTPLERRERVPLDLFQAENH